VNPKHPIYIVSKGRWKSALTARALERMRVQYRIVVEPQEYANYACTIHPDKILTLPFSNLGQGSIPARNWIWEHSIAAGDVRHWILDDNIEAFNRLNRNMKPVVETGAIFRAAEEFVERYENVPLAGFNYYSFCKATEKIPPYYLNTRIYSCILIQNSLSVRWRGRYNEDTDLSIRVLKAGHCTILFNAFLAGKVCTMRMKGGNTDELYKDDGRKLMAESLAVQHPDIVKVVWKFKRWQHQVNYKPFKRNKLIRRCNLSIRDGVDNYGMRLVECQRGQSCSTNHLPPAGTDERPC
jgi:hypothetical protein